MSGEIHRLPLSIDVQVGAWEAYDRAHRAMNALYADPKSDRGDRLAASIETVRLWKRWQAVFLRSVA
jgi:hypothetical protein